MGCYFDLFWGSIRQKKTREQLEIIHHPRIIQVSPSTFWDNGAVIQKNVAGLAKGTTPFFHDISWLDQGQLVGGLEHFLWLSIQLGIIIPTDEVIFFRRVGQPPTSSWLDQGQTVGITYCITVSPHCSTLQENSWRRGGLANLEPLMSTKMHTPKK